MAAVIKDIIENSIAEEVDIKPGDILLSINGFTITDIIEYQFYTSEELLDIEIKKSNNEIWAIEIEKDYDEDLGLIFEGVIFDTIKSCKNKCAFCFIDQLPPLMRETLYIKDDDYRYSFLYGNFITLTNLDENDWEKIINLRLSPLYISVHSTNGEIREKLMNNKNAKKIKSDLERLKDANIQVHTQIVLCPGINDGEELIQTIDDLINLYPSVLSIGIVPVGLTGYRENLESLRPVSPKLANELIPLIEDYQKKNRKKYGSGLVYLADEFYIKADIDFPEAEYYDDFSQIENGIGLARILLDEFEELKKELPDTIAFKESSYIVTGESAQKVLEPLVFYLNQIDNIDVKLIPVKNNYFKGDVTVTGLLTGNDIIKAINGNHKGKRIILPDVVLKEGQILLDDTSLEDIEEKTGADIKIVDGSARDLIRAVLA
ncbi:Fe-S oxidoreductase, related to NifB/MoaA family with PDZ N-terminal domain [Candidatus Syntrophocurvum alkaliphilum]|uniref:Fe-S oxidoreductase, related to NifB/MoaA family with PDZ N-terminal domain n=1 Tax=Candidatus Syntrophocurvum alkaliphilum TaxID=2293317 RepID=A0A6I6DAW5_9FIRM|nr:DUF512 domain-containing protein [Candidatus Syntrophocurvum alkaliphilum]QGT99835.1 Fe-S oxidoreductase, related to NifB/MoaA family with PDZ N-terminal domain [Candidatus Syntrophocurvum alkaliphilum]